MTLYARSWVDGEECVAYVAMLLDGMSINPIGPFLPGVKIMGWMNLDGGTFQRRAYAIEVRGDFPDHVDSRVRMLTQELINFPVGLDPVTYADPGWALEAATNMAAAWDQGYQRAP